jgi:protein-tyrosine phosphatase
MPIVLFVCTANMIRSPIASALFAQKLAKEGMKEKWQSASAGTWARDGYPAARESQEIMAQMEIDLSRHRSRVINEELLKSADLVLVMEHGHNEALRFEFPAYKDRVFILCEMSGPGMNVHDPVGGTKEDFHDTIRDIQNLIDQGFSRMIELAQSQSARQ